MELWIVSYSLACCTILTTFSRPGSSECVASTQIPSPLVRMSAGHWQTGFQGEVSGFNLELDVELAQREMKRGRRRQHSISGSGTVFGRRRPPDDPLGWKELWKVRQEKGIAPSLPPTLDTGIRWHSRSILRSLISTCISGDHHHVPFHRRIRHFERCL